MQSKLKIHENASCEVVRASRSGLGPHDRLGMQGKFTLEHWRNGRLLNRLRLPNTITNEGKDKILDVMFNGPSAPGAQIDDTDWKVGLVDNAGFSAVAAGDTYEQIDGTNGWDEFQGYSEASRPTWTAGDASSQAVTNSSPVVFNINASGAVRGLFIAGGTNAGTKGDNTAGNILWSAAEFSGGSVSVGTGDQLKVTYTAQA